MISQPVTTTASINYAEAVSSYDFDFNTDIEYTIGANLIFDFSSFGDIAIEYGPEEERPTAPAKEVPPAELPSFSMFRIDQAYRRSFGLPLPENVTGLNLAYGESDDVDDLIFTVKPSGLYSYAYKYTYDKDGTTEIEVELETYEEPFIPLNLHYGESFDTTITYLTSSEYEGISDSTIEQTTFQYLGYGKMRTWTGKDLNVGAILVTVNEQYFRANASGAYDEADEYLDEGIYFMTAESVIPRAVLDGTYDTTKMVFSASYVQLLLPTSDVSSAVHATGIPNAAIEIFPNPTHGAFRVDLTLDRSSSLDVELYTPTGRLLSRRTGLAVTPGLNRIPVSGKDLPGGVYLVRLELADGSHETRRVVVH